MPDADDELAGGAVVFHVVVGLPVTGNSTGDSPEAPGACERQAACWRLRGV